MVRTFVINKIFNFIAITMVDRLQTFNNNTDMYEYRYRYRYIVFYIYIHNNVGVIFMSVVVVRGLWKHKAARTPMYV